jgi:ribosome-associated protein
MANEYISNEVNKVLSDKKLPFPLNHAMASACILANLKGLNLKMLDMGKATSALCDYSLIVSASNPTQARAMVDEVAYQLKQHGAQMHSLEGYDSADWILLDTGDIIVHVFLETTRDVFDLDRLFTSYPQIKIPDEFYFGPTTPATAADKDHLKNYF